MFPLARWLVLSLLPWIILARPLVRNVRSTHEFDRLLKKHSEETGLPVIVDFYSDSCGPCRMMAPIFQKTAKKYLDKAVFVKVDTNAQYELSSRYQIRSLPTFQFFLGGRKVHQAVGGIGEGGLIQEVDSMVRQAEAENVVLSLDALTEYYGKVDASKAAEDIATVHKKCVDMATSKSVKECVGGPANQLARRLKKKYKSAPKLTPRFTEEDRKTKSDGSGGGDDDDKPKEKPKASSSKTNASGPNLHMATKEQLMEELEKRMDEERDAQVENEDPLEDEANPEFHSWTSSGYPEKMIVLGGGPAGWAAAIYGARAGLKPLVLSPSMGGQLQGKGVEVENYPGVSLGTTGPALVADMRKQALHFGATVEDDIAIKIIPGQPLKVVTNATGTIESHTVVVATGAEANWLQVPGEYEMRGGGVSSCATCDGFLFAKQHVVVVGGGDAAMEDALVLARTSSRVTLVHRRDAFRASKVLADRVLDHPNIEVRWNTTVLEILGKEVEATANEGGAGGDDVEDLDTIKLKVVRGVVLEDVTTKKRETFECQAVFVAIGHTPTTSFLKGVVEFQDAHPGYIATRPGSTATSVPGLFAAGDVADAVYRQAITSAGNGAAAALDAERYLSEHGLGTEQDDLEAELLAELLSGSDIPSSPSAHTIGAAAGDDEEYYNVYNDAEAKAQRQQFARESVKAEL
ncbi:hypothetical protein ACA910_022085 [Epithemia clementina (nom. ined.)]